VDEQQGTVIQKELAAEPLSACTELDLIRPTPFGIERQAHEKKRSIERGSPRLARR
jgi:hypothetical protein